MPKTWISRGRKYLFVGEGPGKEEDKLGRPFVGPAGQLLRDLWRRAGIDDDDVALANAVRCRPTRNATPNMRQVRSCRPFLLRVVEVCQPTYVAALGVTAVKALADDGGIGNIAGLRGRKLVVPGLSMPVLPTVWATYHPAAILHGNTALAKYIVEDLGRTWETTAPPETRAPGTTGLELLAIDTEFAPDGSLLTVGFADPQNFAVAYEHPCPEIESALRLFSLPDTVSLRTLTT